VVKARPDGYTILVTDNAPSINATLYDNLPFNFIRDIAPVACLSREPLAIEVHPSVPAKTIPEFIAFAKANPGKVNMASPGTGTPNHMAGELFATMAGIKMTHVPYRGAPPLVQDLVGGRIDISNSTLPSVLAQVNAGQIRALAIGSAKRNAKLPNVPTLEEQGVSGANASSWAAFFAPAGTPAPILDRLSGEILASLRKPDVLVRIDQLGFTVDPRDPAAFRPYQEREIATWVKIAKDAGIQPEE
jgi:tripartite-type tricarboxylate transporter receptor subunit TctC